jgi:carboxypeptidase C (cathepsin A)
VKFIDQFPEFKRRSIILAGESYAGRYVPAIAEYIFKRNNMDIVLKSIAIGNGYVSPASHFNSMPIFALENNLISLSEFTVFKPQFE